MKSIAGGFVVALLLLAAGAVLWSQAGFSNRVAEAHRRLAVLQYDPGVAIDSTTGSWDARRWQTGMLAEDVQRHRATVTYWLARYDALTPLLTRTGPEAVKDPVVLFAAANATFRTSAPEVGDRREATERLDRVMQAYADVLRVDPSHVDAAYNYEYVARVRDTIAKGRKPLHPVPNPTDAIRADLPIGPTVHGRPGAPPPSVDLSEFKTLTPMMYKEREEQMKPGRGGPQRRKG